MEQGSRGWNDASVSKKQERATLLRTNTEADTSYQWKTGLQTGLLRTFHVSECCVVLCCCAVVLLCCGGAVVCVCVCVFHIGDPLLKSDIFGRRKSKGFRKPDSFESEPTRSDLPLSSLSQDPKS